MAEPLSASAQKVQDFLAARGFELEVVELPASTRTALDAANAIGVTVGQIVKSLIFRAKRSHRAVLVIASGANRVNEKRIETLLGEPLGKADAEFVRIQTGYAIGGVPPVAHANPLPIYVDQDLLQYDEIWAAAGTPHAVFRLTPPQLLELTGGQATQIN
ncbi:MAG TPA: YbaK/EbsC family protein [Anaerolineales bacterium]|nr:YbaK/EbsC family protein [Anaerolineales bacterium]